MKNLKNYRLFVMASVQAVGMLYILFASVVSSGMGITKPSVNRFYKHLSGKDNPIKALYYIYDSLHLGAVGLSEPAFEYAIKGYSALKMNGKLTNDKTLSIIDFTKPSSEKRLYVLDMEHLKLLFFTYVAHGRNTGQEYANNFSNRPESLQSSLGFYRTIGTYMGRNGFSMQLEGLESGINDRATTRAIVMHGASYVSEDFIKKRGFLGRSYGCPAVPQEMSRPIIERIKNGSCLFIYSNNSNYISSSKFLNS